MGGFTNQRQHLRGDAAIAAGVAHLNALRSEFHLAAAQDRDRLRDAWANLEIQRKRAASEWAEADRYFTYQTAQLDSRALELEEREQTTADQLAHAEAETAGLRQEAAAIELRVRNSRDALAELERRRDLARAELLGTEFPAELPPDADDLTRRERLLIRERARVAGLEVALEREAADLNDRRRLAAEQLAQLADARVQWLHAERETVAEMEELARALRRRELDQDKRDQKLIRADARRRHEAYDLWQLRLHLEVWQTKLTAFELRWHTEREQLETNLECRIAAVSRAETELTPRDGCDFALVGNTIQGVTHLERQIVPVAASAEVVALRTELERLATVVLDMEWPEPPPVEDSELPWGEVTEVVEEIVNSQSTTVDAEVRAA